MKTQSEMILKELKRGRRLTPLDALFEFNCFRLGARCYDLRQQGYNIVTEIGRGLTPLDALFEFNCFGSAHVVMTYGNRATTL